MRVLVRASLGCSILWGELPIRGSRGPICILVWAFSELLVQPMESAGIYELYRQKAAAAAERSKPQPVKTVPQPGSMEWFEAQKKKG